MAAPIKRFTVEEYHRLIETGIISDDDLVELLEGFLVSKKAKTPIVCTIRGLVAEAVRPLLPAHHFHDRQGPVTTDDSEPEPDITIILGKPRDYSRQHPAPSHTKLLVEVSDASLQGDREKRRIYARSNFPIYWIFNIPERQIEVYTQPSGPVDHPAYANVAIYKDGDSVPVIIDRKEIGRINVKDVLP